jgi:cyclohexanone monooxygenase
MSQNHVDVLIVGAGISGIGVAAHLTREAPQKKFAILERRRAIGGTWDLFRYPGIRSDSDMSTFGYEFRPWTESKVLADGPAIRGYVNDTAKEYKISDKIHFDRHVKTADWSSKNKVWTLTVENTETGKAEQWTANFLIGCTGYYNYDEGFQPDYPGQEKFKGQFIHPQHWPENLDYAGKKVVIIGSGATAITLVPAMAPTAGHVTMLQRSPTYIASIPAIDPVFDKMKKVMPEKLAYKLTRDRNIAFQRLIFKLSQDNPKLIKRLLLTAIKRQVGKNVDMRHFTPSYNPWDQRLCVVPNGDLFKTLRSGKASVETDHIERFTEKGILLKSGKELEADIVVSATGLNIQILGGTKTSVDGQPLQTNDHMMYKGVLLSDVPNAAIIVGYINASWTLKVDIAAKYLSRLINYMDANKYKVVVPKADDSQRLEDTIMGKLSSGYIARAANVLPKQGAEAPWSVTNNYLADRVELRDAQFDDGVLQFDDKTGKPSKKRFKLFG